MDFERKFQNWLDEALKEPIPSSVKAFSFNLFEYHQTPEVMFGVELVGTSTFDETNSDWACDEVWEPRTRSLEIPLTFSTRNWEECLKKIKLQVINYLNAESLLNGKFGVGIGFVDGDLELIWRA